MTMETQLTHSGPMNPMAVQPASFEGWQALVAPGDVFRHPRDVLAHPHLTLAEKRAVLASWASDACAMENAPGLRCLTGMRAEPVPVDAVLGALAALDREAAPGSGAAKARERPRGRRSRRWGLRWYVRPRRRRDDDDPPPCPAAIMTPPRPRTPPDGAGLALCLPG